MINRKSIAIFLFAACFLFWSCEYGTLGGADKTDTFYPGEPIFEERLGFLSGIWYSHYAGIGRLDGYRIRKESNLTPADIVKAQALFPSVNINSLVNPAGSNYILLYDDMAYGQQDDGSGGQESWGYGFMGLVRAINIFNGDKNRGAIIIEYFTGTDPKWLSGTQGLALGEKPFFGIYYRVLGPNIVQMANAVDLAAMYAGKHYYTEKRTFEEAVDFNSVENEAEFISWGVVIPQDREK